MVLTAIDVGSIPTRTATSLLEPGGMKRKRVVTTLNASERLALAKVRRYVKGFTGINTTAEALRFLVRNWSES